MEPENRFTPARPFCPNPEYWHSRDSESTEYEISKLVAALVTAIQPEFVVETGTAYGITAYNIGMALLKNGHGRLVSLEADKHMFKDAQDRIAQSPFLLPVELRLENSMDYVPPQIIDFAFFDSWQEGRAIEFLRFYNMGLLKGGTIVTFHDTAPHHQVWKYVKELEDIGLIKTITIHSPRGLTIAQVI
jgi:predicted O-methyltransferase YrrM